MELPSLEKGSTVMEIKMFKKGSTVVELKSLKSFHRDGTKKVLQNWSKRFRKAP